MVTRTAGARIGCQRPSHEEPPAPVAEIAAVDSLAECLPRALQDLDAADREAIKLCDLECMKQAEYARAKGISLAGAKSRVQRARRRLKQALQACCQIRYDESGSICCYALKPFTQES
nr:sigma factor-like helix-turn-helix DNA-binding protein [Thiolapillus sp.]